MAKTVAFSSHDALMNIRSGCKVYCSCVSFGFTLNNKNLIEKKKEEKKVKAFSFGFCL